MKNLENKRVLITGGASGIGKIMARLMLEKKAQVIIWDINEQAIHNVVKEFASLGTISGYCIDISKVDEILEQAKNITEKYKGIDVLINNAGIVVGKYFQEHTDIDIEKTMAINANAPMHIGLVFLKGMMNRNSGHICNIASSGGLISNPKMSVYVASKWSLIGWSDSLRLEMKKQKINIHVTTIMPYYINTGMFDGVKSRIPILKPEKAAKTIIRAIEKNKTMVTLPSYMYRTVRFAQAIMPINFFDWFVGSVLGIYKTMEQFIGRK
jgi:short-subunit dehydrogenase